jgi:hypothetical protein
MRLHSCLALELSSESFVLAFEQRREAKKKRKRRKNERTTPRKKKGQQSIFAYVYDPWLWQLVSF